MEDEVSRILADESAPPRASVAEAPVLTRLAASYAVARSNTNVWRVIKSSLCVLAALTALTLIWAHHLGTAPVFFLVGGVITTLASRLQLGRARARAAPRAELSTAELCSVLAAVDEGITVQDAQGRLIYANAPAAQLLGYATTSELLAATPEQIMARLEVFAPDGSPFPRTELPGRRVLLGLSASEQLVRFRARTGDSDRWALVRAKPVHLGGAAVPFAVNVFRDVTDQRREQHASHLNREWFATALRSIGDALIATDAAGRVTFMNPQAEALTGWTASEADAKPLADVFRIVNEDTRRSVESPMERVLRDGRVVGLANHTLLISRDGTEIAIEETASPIRSQAGELVGAVLVFRDVSNKRREARQNAALFAQIEAARVEAEQANRAKDEFLAMLGHELRNPLAPIVTALQLMRLKGADQFEKERSIIERQVRHVVTLVDDLLDVSRITRGKVELDAEDLELAAVVEKAFELANPLIEQRQHDVSVSIPRKLRVRGDPARLSQVFSNLLTNAAKYTPPRGHISVRAESGEGEVSVMVRDDGAGLEPELLRRIFDLFVQGGQALDRAQGGLGLGLVIVRSVVELHGGHVSAHSEGPGKGSEFRVDLPLLARGASVPARPPSRTPIENGLPPSGARVLLVDDNHDALLMLSEALQLKGYTTLAAEDAATALTAAEKHKPAVALLDIGLPVLNGYELARRLRATPGLESIKLAALTGYGQPADKQRAMEAGFDEHLVKPISIEVVQAVVSRLLGAAYAR